VGVDDVKLLLAESAELSPIGRVGDRVAFTPGGFEGSEADGVGVGFLVSRASRGKDVDGVALVSELVDEELDADADSVDDGPNAVREYRDAKWLHAPAGSLLLIRGKGALR
jgi:hypothetical protein